VDIDERHGTGELGDGIGDTQLDVPGTSLVVRDHCGMVYGLVVLLAHRSVPLGE
jgi:hypothetical protein